MKFKTSDPENQCVGKEPFSSFVLANAVAIRPRTQRKDKMEAYRCPHCGFWHIGHRPGKRAMKNVKGGSR